MCIYEIASLSCAAMHILPVHLQTVSYHLRSQKLSAAQHKAQTPAFTPELSWSLPSGESHAGAGRDGAAGPPSRERQEQG